MTPLPSAKRLAFFLAATLFVAAALTVFLYMNAETIAGVYGVAPAEDALGWSPAARGAEATPADEGFLYGRVIGRDGGEYEGRLRFGGDEETFWNDVFNGVKNSNPWADAARAASPEERNSFAIFGKEIHLSDRFSDLQRPFAARFGDLTRIDAHGSEIVRATLKSGTVVDLARFEAGDFDDGVRVWDAVRGVVDLDSLWIRSIELLPPPALGNVPQRLYGTARTDHGEEFTGFIQWNRRGCVASDHFADEDGEVLRFADLRSVTRSSGGVRATLHDGREIELADGDAQRGVTVVDPRYGRVSIPWNVFERVDFAVRDSGSAYDDFPPGEALTGSVETGDGRRLAGRLVFDLDESETTDTLDASFQGVSYSIALGDIASIVPQNGPTVAVMLHNGLELQLERFGDLGDDNAGLLVFAEDPEYIPWSDVRRVDFGTVAQPEKSAISPDSVLHTDEPSRSFYTSYASVLMNPS